MAEHNSSNEEFAPPRIEPFSTANNLIKETYEILKEEAARVRKEKEAFDSVAKKLEHVHFAKTIKLNVGGQYFTTSLETLTKDPGSMLHAMFSGRFDTKPAEDGSYFIDRDGTHFRYILNYLRTGRLILPDDTMTWEEVFVEAEFYQVQGIIDEMKPKPVEEFDLTILSVEHWKVLTSWIKEELEQPAPMFVLLFRASRDGWASYDFHRHCDNMGPTITVLKSGNYIFGGYTDQSWDCSDAYKACTSSFIFSLVNPADVGPTKMALKADKKGYGMYCHRDHCPTFGAGHDLYITNVASASANSYSNITNSYEGPPNQSGTTFLVGSKYFIVKDFEVFGYQK